MHGMVTLALSPRLIYLGFCGLLSFKSWSRSMYGLLELKNPTRSFTWTDNQEQPIRAAVYNIFFCTTASGQNYLFIRFCHRDNTRAGSDHVPLILNLDFEKWWLEQPDFRQLVTKLWSTPCAFTHPLDVCQFKTRLVQWGKRVEGWALNINPEIRKQKT